MIVYEPRNGDGPVTFIVEEGTYNSLSLKPALYFADRDIVRPGDNIVVECRGNRRSSRYEHRRLMPHVRKRIEGWNQVTEAWFTPNLPFLVVYVEECNMVYGTMFPWKYGVLVPANAMSGLTYDKVVEVCL